MSKKIETVLKAINIKKFEMPSDNMYISSDIDPSIYGKLSILLNTHQKLESTQIFIKNKPVSINEYAIPQNHWLCTLCKSVTSDAQLECSKCTTYRNIETFPNIIENPMKATEIEIKLLKERRAHEKEMICARDLLTPEILPMDDSWYLISTDWLTQWKAFIFNKPCKNSRISPNSAIGVLPPGPISNYSLFQRDKQTLKDGLQRVFF